MSVAIQPNCCPLSSVSPPLCLAGRRQTETIFHQSSITALLPSFDYSVSEPGPGDTQHCTQPGLPCGLVMAVRKLRSQECGDLAPA